MNPTDTIDTAILLSGHQKIANPIGDAWESAKSYAQTLYSGAQGAMDAKGFVDKAKGFWETNKDRIKDDARYAGGGAAVLGLGSLATSYRRPGESEQDYRRRRFRETLSSMAMGAVIGGAGREGYKELTGDNKMLNREGVISLAGDKSNPKMNEKALSRIAGAAKSSPQLAMKDLVAAGYTPEEAMKAMAERGLDPMSVKAMTDPMPEKIEGLVTPNTELGMGTGAALGAAHHIPNHKSFNPLDHVSGPVDGASKHLTLAEAAEKIRAANVNNDRVVSQKLWEFDDAMRRYRGGVAEGLGSSKAIPGHIPPSVMGIPAHPEAGSAARGSALGLGDQRASVEKIWGDLHREASTAGIAPTDPILKVKETNLGGSPRYLLDPADVDRLRNSGGMPGLRPSAPGGGHFMPNIGRARMIHHAGNALGATKRIGTGGALGYGAGAAADWWNNHEIDRSATEYQKKMDLGR